MREFSSSHDLKHAHPILDRTLDIIAGPEEDSRTNILEKPYAVTTDSAQRVFVTDLNARVVHVFDFLRSKYFVLQGNNRLQRPVGVAADPEGNIYVTDSGTGAILTYDSRGKFRRFLKRSGRESYFEAPWGIAVDMASEHIYVSDYSRHMVIILDRKGHVLGHLGNRGGGVRPGEFRFPTQVAITRNELVVLDSGNLRLQIFDLHKQFRREIRLIDSDNRSGLAVDEKGNTYVSDAVVNHVSVFNPEGQLLYSFGQKGTKPGEFDEPAGLWLQSGRCLYVADGQNKRVQSFEVNEGGHNCP